MEPQEPKIVEVGGVKVEAGSQAYWVEKGIHEKKVQLEEFKKEFQQFLELHQRSFAHNLSDEEMAQNETQRSSLLNELEEKLKSINI